MSLEYYLRSPTMPDVCDVFGAVAKDTWERIKFSRSNAGMKVHETAITQNLVYEMRLLKDRFRHLEYFLYESRNEKTNGNDLLLRVRHLSGEVYTYAIQAKIIYHTITSKKSIKLRDGYYTQFKHMVSRGTSFAEPQVDKLLRFSRRNGYIPMYLLYNYVSTDYTGTIHQGHGCTVISAHFMKNNYTDPIDNDLRNDVKFSYLHTTSAFAWEALVCSFPSLDKDELLEIAKLPKDYTLRIGGESDLITDEKWIDLSLEGRPSEYIKLDKHKEVVNNEPISTVSPDFSPRYCIDVSSK